MNHHYFSVILMIFCGIFYLFGGYQVDPNHDEMTRLTSSLCLRSVSGLYTMSVSPMTFWKRRREQSLALQFHDCWVEYGLTIDDFHEVSGVQTFSLSLTSLIFCSGL